MLRYDGLVAAVEFTIMIGWIFLITLCGRTSLQSLRQTSTS